MRSRHQPTGRPRVFGRRTNTERGLWPQGVSGDMPPSKESEYLPQTMLIPEARGQAALATLNYVLIFPLVCGGSAGGRDAGHPAGRDHRGRQRCRRVPYGHHSCTQICHGPGCAPALPGPGAERLRRARRPEGREPARPGHRPHRHLPGRRAGQQFPERPERPRDAPARDPGQRRGGLRPEQPVLPDGPAGLRRQPVRGARGPAGRLVRHLDALRALRREGHRAGSGQRPRRRGPHQGRFPLRPGQRPADRQRPPAATRRLQRLRYPDGRRMAAQILPQRLRPRHARLPELALRGPAEGQEFRDAGAPAQGLLGPLHAESQRQGRLGRHLLQERLGRQRLRLHRPAAQLLPHLPAHGLVGPVPGRRPGARHAQGHLL